jgi:hypothetical protein
MNGPFGNEHPMTFLFHVPNDGTKSTLTLDWNGQATTTVLPDDLESILTDAFSDVYDGLTERL